MDIALSIDVFAFISSFSDLHNHYNNAWLQGASGMLIIGRQFDLQSDFNLRLLLAYPPVLSSLSSLLSFHVTILLLSLRTLTFGYGLQTGAHFWWSELEVHAGSKAY